MKRYANRSGDSGVAAYELRAGAIRVRFAGGDTYEYNVASAGPEAIDEMQRLAEAGSGLSRFIAQQRPAFSRKLG